MGSKKIVGLASVLTLFSFANFNGLQELELLQPEVAEAKVVRRVVRRKIVRNPIKKEESVIKDNSTSKIETAEYSTPPKSKVEDGDVEVSKDEVKYPEKQNSISESNTLISQKDINGVSNRLGDYYVPITDYIVVNKNAVFKKIVDTSVYGKYSEYLSNGMDTYAIEKSNISIPIEKSLFVDGNLVVSNALYLKLQENAYEIKVSGNLVILDDGVLRCCMEQATDSGTNTIYVEGDIVFDGKQHSMSINEQSYGFNVPTGYARTTRSLQFICNGIWYAVNGKSDNYYDLSGIKKQQTKHLTSVPKPDVPSLVDSVKGDVNNDKSIDNVDVELLKQYIAERIKDSQINMSNADMNGDGKVTLTDLSQLKVKVEEKQKNQAFIKLTPEEVRSKWPKYYDTLTRNNHPFKDIWYYTGKPAKDASCILQGNLLLDKFLNVHSFQVSGNVVICGNGAIEGAEVVSFDSIPAIYGDLTIDRTNSSTNSIMLSSFNVLKNIYLFSMGKNDVIHKLIVSKNTTLEMNGRGLFRINALYVDNLSSLTHIIYPLDSSPFGGYTHIYLSNIDKVDPYWDRATAWIRLSGEDPFNIKLEPLNLRYNTYLEGVYLNYLKVLVPFLLVDVKSSFDKLPFFEVTRGSYRTLTKKGTNGANDTVSITVKISNDKRVGSLQSGQLQLGVKHISLLI